MYTSVSIPLWFDWKRIHQRSQQGTKQFQFHFGSIGRFSGTFSSPFVRRFNSTLVRLEAKWPLHRAGSLRFQFHFGSIGSCTHFCMLTQSYVSIPLWFDWKLSEPEEVLRGIRFNSTLVRLEALQF